MAKKSAQRAGKKKQTTKKNEKKPKWTVMVFMGADNLPDEVDLSEYADDDIKEMKKVKVRPDDSLNIFVQRHGKGFVERHHIGKGKPFDVDQDELDATNGKALIAFMRWALETAEHDRNDHSMLVLWGHAYRFGIGHAATRVGIDALDFAELRAVLSDFQEEYKSKHKKEYGPKEMPKIDIVGFDACDLATIEMAYQLHPFATYLLASEIGVPLPGWPYDEILKRLKDPPGDPMSPKDLGSYVVRQFCIRYHPEKEDLAVSLTLLNLQQTKEIFQLAQDLGRTLAAAVERDTDERERVLNVFYQSQTLENKPFVDVADLCLNLTRYSGDLAVGLAAARLGDALISPNRQLVVQNSRNGDGVTTVPFVVEHGGNGHETAKLHGVSLYAPHVAADTHDWAAASYWYKKFVFANETIWSSLVHALAQPSSSYPW